jgi:hypothetical protein
MILQEYRGQLLVVRQSDHGIQTGLFAERWGNDDTPPFGPRQSVIDAGVRHDNGWIDWEEHPTLDPETGQPWQFLKLTPHEHVPLYQRGIQMAADHDLTTGLLVSMHGAGLYNDRYGTFRLAERHFSDAERIIVEEFLAEQALFQQSLGQRILGRELHSHVTTDPHVWYNYLLLQVWDRLQLQFAFRLAADGEIAPLPRPDGSTVILRVKHVGEFSVALDPYPFDVEPVIFPMIARLLPNRIYRNAEDFLAQMTKTPETQIPCRVTRR